MLVPKHRELFEAIHRLFPVIDESDGRRCAERVQGVDNFLEVTLSVLTEVSVQALRVLV